MMRCNICGKQGSLTEDHVPPKFWNNNKIKDYTIRLGSGNPERASKAFPFIARKGITFNSICADCNNRVLGIQADKALKEFIDAYKKEVPGGSLLPFYVSIEVNRVARAIVGHMLAAKKEYDGQTIIDQDMRDFVLNPSSLPSGKYKLLFYPYCFKSIVIGRDFISIGESNSRVNNERLPQGTISILASFPVSFLLIENYPENDALEMDDLFSYCTNNIDEKKSVRCKRKTQYYHGTNSFRHPLWPLDICGDYCAPFGVLAGNPDSIIFAIGRE